MKSIISLRECVCRPRLFVRRKLEAPTIDFGRSSCKCEAMVPPASLLLGEVALALAFFFGLDLLASLAAIYFYSLCLEASRFAWRSSTFCPCFSILYAREAGFMFIVLRFDVELSSSSFSVLDIIETV